MLAMIKDINIVGWPEIITSKKWVKNDDVSNLLLSSIKSK